MKLEKVKEKEIRERIQTKKNRDNSRNSSGERTMEKEYYHNPWVY